MSKLRQSSEEVRKSPVRETKKDGASIHWRWAHDFPVSIEPSSPDDELYEDATYND